MNRERLDTISVIVPVFNGQATLAICLDALNQSTLAVSELIVTDDCSTDGSASVASTAGATVLTTDRRSGPAAARNLGAMRASGDIVCFIDADCEVHADTLERIARGFDQNPEVDAIFGSYDERPAAPGFIAQYKNLAHRYVHQTSSENATTFWAGCGAVRRATFLAIGGFDATIYPRPSIEDIELGYRLSEAGHRILLDKDVQVTHHKAWTLSGMIHSDIFDRAIPWTKLLLIRGKKEKNLNLAWQHRASAALVALLVVTLVLTPFVPVAFAVVIATVSLLLWMNFDFYRYLARLRGFIFALKAAPIHWLTLLYSAAAYAITSARHTLARRDRSAAGGTPGDDHG